jgi:anti-sigma B factor antagonist
MKSKKQWTTRLLVRQRPGNAMEIDTHSSLVPSASRNGTAVVASIKGEIDLHNSPELRQVLLHTLIKPDVQSLKLNLREVPYVDSSAIAVFVEGIRHMPKGGEIVLVNVQPRVMGLLQIARLDTIFKIVQEA